MEENLRQLLFDPNVGKLVTIVVGLVVIFVFGRFLQSSVGRHIKDTPARYRARKLTSFAVYVMAALLALTVFSDRLAGLTVAFGVAGAGIAIALQEAIASVAGWIAVSFGNFYRPGDRVRLGGIKGDVIDIGVIRTTRMELGDRVDADLYNGRIVRIANSQVFKQPVFNYSADFPFVWDEITLPVRYGSDWKLASQMLVGVADEVCKDFALQSVSAWKEAVNKYRLEAANVEPMVTMVANDNWLQFTSRFIVDYRNRRSTKDLLFTRILEEVDKSNDRIRLAYATFELVNIPRLDVSFSQGAGRVEPTYVP